MPRAYGIVFEMYGAVRAPSAGVVVPFPKVADPERCRQATTKRFRKLSACPGTLVEAQRLLTACNACLACFAP